MALPLSRNTTYSPGSQVKSADLNDIQDQIIAGSHGERRIALGAGDWDPGWVTNMSLVSLAAAGGGGNAVVARTGSTAAFAARWRVPAKAGDRIKAWGITWDPNAAAGPRQIAAQLWKTSALNSATPAKAAVGSQLVDGMTGNYEYVTHALASPPVVAAGELYHLEVVNVSTGNPATIDVWYVDFLIDRP